MIGVFVAIASLEQLRLLTRLTSKYVSEDQALLWAAARDWAGFAVREPTFYGQNYGSTLESIPIAALRGLGASYPVALSLALSLMFLASWWLVAAGAWRRGWTIAAVFAAAAPVLVSTDHAVIQGVYGTAFGRLLAAWALFVALAFERRPASAAAVVGAAGLAVLVDSSSALVAVPTLVWAAWGWASAPRARRFALLGLTAPALWYLFTTWYDRTHPDHALHPAPELDPRWDVLSENLGDPGRLLDSHAPELLRNELVLVGVLVVAVVVLAALRAWRGLASGLSFVAVLLIAASVPRSLDGLRTIWFRPARISLAVLMGIWFVGVLALEITSPRLRLREQRARAPRDLALATLTVLVLATSVVRASTFESRVGDLEDEARAAAGYQLQKPNEIRRACQDVERTASAARTQVVVFPGDRTLAYACAALHPDLTTVHPTYERRTGILRDLADRRVSRLVVWRGDQPHCERLVGTSGITECAVPMGQPAVVVSSRGAAALDVVDALGYEPRPFGDDCRPQDPRSCDEWEQRFDASRR